MNIKKIVTKLKRARNSLLEDPTLSDEDRELLMSINLDDDIENDIAKVKSVTVKNALNQFCLTDEQHYKLGLMEKSGTGSTKIH